MQKKEKEKSVEQFDMIFYKDKECDSKLIGQKTSRKENDIDAGNFEFDDPNLLDYLDLYNITPYKVKNVDYFRFFLNLKKNGLKKYL